MYTYNNPEFYYISPKKMDENCVCPECKCSKAKEDLPEEIKNSHRCFKCKKICVKNHEKPSKKELMNYQLEEMAKKRRVCSSRDECGMLSHSGSSQEVELAVCNYVCQAKGESRANQVQKNISEKESMKKNFNTIVGTPCHSALLTSSRKPPKNKEMYLQVHGMKKQCRCLNFHPVYSHEVPMDQDDYLKDKQRNIKGKETKDVKGHSSCPQKEDEPMMPKYESDIELQSPQLQKKDFWQYSTHGSDLPYGLKHNPRGKNGCSFELWQRVENFDFLQKDCKEKPKRCQCCRNCCEDNYNTSNETRNIHNTLTRKISQLCLKKWRDFTEKVMKTVSRQLNDVFDPDKVAKSESKVCERSLRCPCLENLKFKPKSDYTINSKEDRSYKPRERKHPQTYPIKVHCDRCWINQTENTYKKSQLSTGLSAEQFLPGNFSVAMNDDNVSKDNRKLESIEDISISGKVDRNFKFPEEVLINNDETFNFVYPDLPDVNQIEKREKKHLNALFSQDGVVSYNSKEQTQNTEDQQCSVEDEMLEELERNQIYEHCPFWFKTFHDKRID